MAQADSNLTTKLSQLFRDPFLRAAFAAAEDDGLAPSTSEIYNPRALDGGAAELVPSAGRRVHALEMA